MPKDDRITQLSFFYRLRIANEVMIEFEVKMYVVSGIDFEIIRYVQ